MNTFINNQNLCINIGWDITDSIFQSYLIGSMVYNTNITKICSKCKLEKELIEFHKSKKEKYGVKSICKICKSIIGKTYWKNNKDKLKQYRENNREKIHQYQKLYYNDNKKQILKVHKIYYNKNKKEILNLQKQYYKNNRDNMLKTNKLYRDANKNSIIKQQKIYYNKNRSKILQYLKEYRINYYKENKNRIIQKDIKYNNLKYKTDNLFRLSTNIRSLIRASFRNKNHVKNSKTSDILGCDFNKFKKYLENQYYEQTGNKFNWNNRHLYHLDHKIPISFANNKQEIIKLNHYTNFQFLKKEKNLIKSNNIINIDSYNHNLLDSILVKSGATRKELKQSYKGFIADFDKLK